MKLQDFMDNKVAGDLDYVMPADACADDDVLLERKKRMHLREVNANEYYCDSSEPLSPVKTPEDRGDGESEKAESVCSERINIVGEDKANRVGVSSVSTSSSQENVTTDGKQSPAISSTEDLDKEISVIKAQINALDEISESEYSHCSDEDTSDECDTKLEPSEASMRSLVQIRESLEEKVRNLREDKFVSDQKLRMAQEEDELRVREKIKLRQQLLIHRKERLKKCISDLKRKLDNQSHRLQAGYSSLLALQRTIFRSRSFSAQSRPPRDCDRDVVEAPF